MTKLKKKVFGKFSITKAKAFLKSRPNTSLMMQQILQNFHKTDNKLAKITGRSINTIKRFKVYAINSINGTQKYRGSKTLSAGQKKAKSRIKAMGTQNDNSFKSKRKDVIKERLLKLMLANESPKVGIVATLPYMFGFENMAIVKKALQSLHFHGFEFPYNTGMVSESKKRFKTQLETLKKDDNLGKRVTMFFNNINDVLANETEDRYAHILADYCGTFTTNKSAIENILTKKLIKKGGLLWITLCARDKKLNENNSVKEKKHTNKLMLELVQKAGGSNYKIENIEGQKVFRYVGSETGRGAPMYSMIIRRVK